MTTKQVGPEPEWKPGLSMRCIDCAKEFKAHEEPEFRKHRIDEHGVGKKPAAVVVPPAPPKAPVEPKPMTRLDGSPSFRPAVPEPPKPPVAPPVKPPEPPKPMTRLGGEPLFPDAKPESPKPPAPRGGQPPRRN